MGRDITRCSLMWRTRRRLAASLICWPLLATMTVGAIAEPGYPRKPITVMVPYGPGGLGDVTVRLYAQKLSARLGQQFIVENRPGAGGAMAAKATLASPADGYTLFFPGSGMAISMSLFKTKPFDVVHDFTHISKLTTLGELLFATPANSPLKSVREIVAAGRTKLTIGTINPGSTQNLTAHLFKQTTGIHATIVPHKTTPELITALIRGDVDLAIEYYAGLQPVANDTRMRIVATTGERRSPLLQDVPTMKESGYANFVVTSWNGLAAPKGLPEDVLTVLNRAIVEAGAEPDIRARLLKFGISAGGSTPQEMADDMAGEVKKWSKVIQEAGLTLN